MPCAPPWDRAASFHEFSQGFPKVQAAGFIGGEGSVPFIAARTALIIHSARKTYRLMPQLVGSCHSLAVCAVVDALTEAISGSSSCTLPAVSARPTLIPPPRRPRAGGSLRLAQSGYNAGWSVHRRASGGASGCKSANIVCRSRHPTARA